MQLVIFIYTSNINLNKFILHFCVKIEQTDDAFQKSIYFLEHILRSVAFFKTKSIPTLSAYLWDTLSILRSITNKIGINKNE